ncbi:MAG: hypothetical protein ABSB35_14660 [Bryobacteraceae bacterium]
MKLAVLLPRLAVRAAPFALLVGASALIAQPVRVFSEFAQIDSSGEVRAPAEPREILSPALARNAFTSFQVVVQVAKGTQYRLFISQNPENAVRLAVFREAGDRLEPIELPYSGETTQSFWLDVWTDRNAPVRRIKIEPQLRVNDDWVVYPIEARVMEATVPDGPWPEGSASPAAVMRAYVCGTKIESGPAARLSMSRLRFRNAQQDVGLAPKSPKQALRDLIGGCDAPLSEDAEWYLRVRDYLFRMR